MHKQSKVFDNKKNNLASPDSNYRVFQSFLSPKYDRQKAFQNEIQRKRLNHQKLERFNQYNTMIIQKAFRQNNFNKKIPVIARLKSERSLVYRNQPTKYQKEHFLNIIQKSNKRKECMKQKYLVDLKQKNFNLHQKNYKLNNHLEQLGSGVKQLQAVLQQVELTQKQIQIINPEFMRLITNQNYIEQQSFYDQKHTKETIQFQSQKKFQQFEQDVYNIQNYQHYNDYLKNIKEAHMHQNILQYDYKPLRRNTNTQDLITKNQKIKSLQSKFKIIIKKLQMKSSTIINEREGQQFDKLDQIELELDLLKTKLKGKKSTDYPKINIHKRKQSKQSIWSLSNVKSLNNLKSI